MSAHIAFDTLNDYVDGTLRARERAAVEAHLAGCAGCRHELDTLRATLDEIAGAPRVLLPDDALWGDVRAAIERRRVVALPADHAARGGAGRVARWTRRERALLATAAVLLLVAVAALAALARRQAGGAGEMARAEPTVAPPPALLPASLRSLEADYQRTAEELTAALEARRDELSPETIATVERSVRVIDDAIREARDALLRDPANATLVDLLASGYEQKVRLLRRATELTTTI